jgi:acetyl-CoA C-acetyltransferase
MSRGTATAGNSCGVNDGAAVVAVTDTATRRWSAAPGLCILSTATAGVDPNRPGQGSCLPPEKRWNEPS